MDDVGWLGKIVQTFGLPAAAWAAVCAFIVHLVKLRNERLRDVHVEKESDWSRIRAERDGYRDEARCLRTKLADSEREKVELLGRAVIAEAENIGLNKALQRPIMLPGSEGMKGNGG